MIILSLVLLIFFAYRGYSIIFIAPVFAVVAAIGSGHDPMPVFSEIYMTKAAEYVKTYYPVFLLGAVFAKIMEEGGLAASVANKIVRTLGKEKAILAILIGCGVLTYGGLSVFVVAFVMYPFAAIYLGKPTTRKNFCLDFCGWAFLLTAWLRYLAHRKFKT